MLKAVELMTVQRWNLIQFELLFNMINWNIASLNDGLKALLETVGKLLHLYDMSIAMLEGIQGGELN